MASGNFNIYKDEYAVSQSVDSWISNYKNASLNQYQDRSELNLVLPDDCLVVIGPPRLSQVSTGSLYVVGFLNSLQFSETRQVQPLKSIGSRRHIFAATNGPVQGSINRLLFVGANIFKAIYSAQNIPDSISGNNSQYEGGLIGNPSSNDSDFWYTNAEEDLFRIPFGMGVIYNAPASMSSPDGGKNTADYIEGCTITNRAIAIQSGQAMMMEQVNFMADRVVGWASWSGAYSGPGTGF